LPINRATNSAERTTSELITVARRMSGSRKLWHAVECVYCLPVDGEATAPAGVAALTRPQKPEKFLRESGWCAHRRRTPRGTR
jgi:hypothetical protein